MAGEEIRAELNVGTGKIDAQLQAVDAKQRLADQKAENLRRAVERLKASLNLAQTQARDLDRMMSRIEGKLTKAGIKMGISFTAGMALSEFGIPEAAQPIAHIGTAAISGAMFGGPWGAAGFATIAMVRELAQAVKAHGESLEKIKAEIIINRRRVEEIKARREMEEEKNRKEMEEYAAISEVRTREEVRNWFHERVRGLLEPQ